MAMVGIICLPQQSFLAMLYQLKLGLNVHQVSPATKVGWHVYQAAYGQ